MNKILKTLGEFIIENQDDFKPSSGELSRIINSIRLAAKIVSHKLVNAGLEDIIGSVGEINVQGEQQQKLDLFANQVFIDTLINRDIICGVASEENEDFININGYDKTNNNKFIVLIDPLDGSTNIDVNVSLGTIFSVYERITSVGGPVSIDDFLQPGINQVAAGYVLYGTSTMLVYSTGNGVNGFTLNSSIGTFYLSHPNIRFPKHGNIYSINEGNFSDFPLSIKKYINYCKINEDDRPYTCRYIGSLVSDFHRNMLKGGVYLYPDCTEYPAGKLRLLYECNPIAFIAEQAGGSASNGRKRILEIKPTELHQRIPFYCGNTYMVSAIELMILNEK